MLVSGIIQVLPASMHLSCPVVSGIDGRVVRGIDGHLVLPGRFGPYCEVHWACSQDWMLYHSGYWGVYFRHTALAGSWPARLPACVQKAACVQLLEASMQRCACVWLLTGCVALPPLLDAHQAAAAVKAPTHTVLTGMDGECDVVSAGCLSKPRAQPVFFGASRR